MVHLLCAGSRYMDGDLYPILFISAPDEGLEINEDFDFLKIIPWKAAIDLDHKARVCQFIEKEGITEIFPDINALEINEGYPNAEETRFKTAIRLSTNRISWIFANGYILREDTNQRFNPVEWKKLRRRGLRNTMQHLTAMIPPERAIVVILLLSHDLETMVNIADDIFEHFPEQWMVIAERKDIAESFQEELIRRNIDPVELEGRSVIGMPWRHVNETAREIVGVRVSGGCQLPTSYGGFCAMSERQEMELFDLEIVASNECDDEARLLENDLFDVLDKAEDEFYHGNQATWWNFWAKSHVLVRDIHEDLKNCVRQAAKRQTQSSSCVTAVWLYHQPGAGGTTTGRQAIWDLRKFFRCAVLTNISEDIDQTRDQILKLAQFEDQNSLPVLLLLDNVDADRATYLMNELDTEIRHATRENMSSHKILVIFIMCIRQMAGPKKHMPGRLILGQKLSRAELQWFDKKYKSLEKGYKEDERRRDPKTLLSFNIMKTNFDPDYIESSVKHFVNDVKKWKEKRLLKYVALLNKYERNHEPVPSAAFDSIMMDISQQYSCVLRHGRGAVDHRWEMQLSEAVKILLNETSVHRMGNIHAFNIISPVLSQAILKTLCQLESKTISDVTLELINCKDIFQNGSIPVERLLELVKSILSKRRRGPDGRLETTFPLLIEDILQNEGISEAAEVLCSGYECTNCPFVAQQVARLLYLKAKDYDKAEEYAKIAVQHNQDNSAFRDTHGQIYKEKLSQFLESLRNNDREISPDAAANILPTGFKGISLFQEANMETKQNLAVPVGELECMARLIECISYVTGFYKNDTVLRRFLNEKEYVPDVVEGWLEVSGVNYVELLKNLKQKGIEALNCIDDRSSQLHEVTLREPGLGNQELYSHLRKEKKIFRHFFGQRKKIARNSLGDEENRRMQVFSLVGFTWKDILSLKDHENGKGKLQEAVTMLKEIISTGRHTADDLQTYITVNLALLASDNQACFNHEIKLSEMTKCSQKLWSRRTTLREQKSLQPYLFYVMLNWPRKNNPWGVGPPLINEAIDLWEKAFLEKHTHMKANQGLKRMKEATVYFFTHGSDMNSLRYSEKIGSRNAEGYGFWRDPEVMRDLQRFSGTLLEGKEVEISVDYNVKLEGRIRIPTSQPKMDQSLWNKTVYFVIGFTWRGPKAFNITKDDPTLDVKQLAKGHNVKVPNPNLPSIKPENPLQSLRAQKQELVKKLSGIESMERRKLQGQTLQSRELEAIARKSELQRELAFLEKRIKEERPPNNYDN